MHIASNFAARKCLRKYVTEAPCSLFSQGQVKLCKSGFYFMTGYGANVSFPIGYVVVLLHSFHSNLLSQTVSSACLFLVTH